jgi:adenosylcobinamide kinase/adenosylcobinamide-phosphate guanylyltransferase
MAEITLITGGVRSGKSRYALALAKDIPGVRAFIATAEPFDDGMRERIRKHREERGNAFVTIEEPLDLRRAVESVPAEAAVAVVDCLTVWLGNLMHHRNAGPGDCPEIDAFLDLLDNPPCSLVIVSNEVGMGIMPPNDMARLFQDLSGRLNQETARRADHVILMVSGVPVVVKGGAR